MYMCGCMHGCIDVWIYMYESKGLDACMFVGCMCVCVYVWMYMYECMIARMHGRIDGCIWMDVYVFMYM